MNNPQQINNSQQIINSQIQNNQNYNALLKQFNNEKLKNINLEKEIQRLKYEINNLKIENNNLKQNLTNANQFNQIKNIQNNQMNINEIYNLKQIIIQKDKEISELKLKLPKHNLSMNDIIVINFLSTDQNIRCGIPCLADDTIAEVEEKLYQQFDEFRNTNNILLSGGNIILRFKKVRENNLHNGDTILIQSQ